MEFSWTASLCRKTICKKKWGPQSNFLQNLSVWKSCTNLFGLRCSSLLVGSISSIVGETGGGFHGLRHATLSPAASLSLQSIHCHRSSWQCASGRLSSVILSYVVRVLEHKEFLELYFKLLNTEQINILSHNIKYILYETWQ